MGAHRERPGCEAGPVKTGTKVQAKPSPRGGQNLAKESGGGDSDSKDWTDGGSAWFSLWFTKKARRQKNRGGAVQVLDASLVS